MKTFLLCLLLTLTACANTSVSKKTFNKIVPSVVAVIQREYDEYGEAKTYYCTGFIVNKDRGLVLTANHCINDNLYTVIDDKYDADLVKRGGDFALLVTEPNIGPSVSFANDVDIVDEVLSIGYGYGELQALVRHVSRTNSNGDLILDGPLARGMSGGPTVNDKGEVVGMNNATAEAVGVTKNLAQLKAFLK